MSMTPAQLINDRGGPAAFAAAIKRPDASVRMMKHRNKIPRAVWPEVIDAYPDLTLDDLRAIEANGSGGPT